MCGIAAFSGIKGLTPEQARVAANKMKILGLYNKSRGVHGCGLYVNGQIFKGIEEGKKNTKEFDDFLSNPDFIWPELDLSLGNIMFLHTRQATGGAHTEANTHPFLIRSQDPKNNLVGVHNGTIENVWTMCTKYDVSYVDKHIQVDSKALYTLIDKVGLDVLKEYKGFAALVWTKPSDPGSIYVYHGAARKERNDEKTYEERPMFYMKTAEGLYFSSMESSLLAIRESAKQEVKCLDYNIVMKVTNGKFTTSRVTIEREEANLPPVVVRAPMTARSNTNSRIAGFDDHRRGEDLHIQALLEEGGRSEALRRARETRGVRVKGNLKTPDVNLTWHETMPKKALATRDEAIVYFHMGRYYRSGGKLCHNVIFIKDRGVIGEEADTGVAPHWFWMGAMMRDMQAWEALVEESKVPGGWVNSLDANFAYHISRFTMCPVTNMDSEAIDKDDFFRFSWYFNERRITTKITPKFSGRCYEIVDGFLVDIKASNPDDKKTIDLPMSDAEAVGQAELALDEVPESEMGMMGIPPHCPVPTSVARGGCGESLAPVAVSKAIRDREGSPFDIIFPQIEELFKVFTPIETEAMVRFVHERMTTEWHYQPTPQEVQAELWSTVRAGCKVGQSVRQSLRDDNMLLDSLAQIISNNRDEEIMEIDSIEAMMQEASPETVDEWKERFYEKHGFYPEKKRVVVVDAQSNPFPDDLPWDSADTETPIDAAYQQFERDMQTEQGVVLDELDKVFAEHGNKIKEDEEAYQLAGRRVDEAIGGMGELCTIADELQALTECTYAQDASHCILTGVGRIKHDLAGICETHHDPEAIRKMNQEIIA